MANQVLPKVALDELKCANCNRYISIGPVKVIHSCKEFLCGRCPTQENEPHTLNIIYEKVAQFTQFPCIYDEFGCKQTFPFGEQMKDHEDSCVYKPNACPLGFFQSCDWLGHDNHMFAHVTNTHPAWVLNELHLNLNLQAKTEQRYIFASEDVVYVMDVFYHAEKGLFMEVMQFTTGVKSASRTYDILLRPCDKPSPSLTFTRAISKYVNAFKTPGYVTEADQVQCVDKNKVRVSIALNWDNWSVYYKQAAKPRVDLTKARLMYCACKNADFGCSFSGKPCEMQEHEELCKLIECPLQSKGCAWKGVENDVYTHCFDHKDVREGYKFKLSDLIANNNTAQFYLLKLCVSRSWHIVRVGIMFDTSNELMYISAQNVRQVDLDNHYYVYSYFQNGIRKTCHKIKCKPLTNDENAFNDCPCISYCNLLESTVEFKCKYHFLESFELC